MRSIGTKFIVAIASLGLLAAGAVANVVGNSASAAEAAGFNPGMIITDEQFYDETSMNADQIQKFLDEKGADCTENCLKDHRQDTQSYPPNLCQGYVGARNESAATILEKVAKSCDINPKVLLVLLEKETSLVTMDGPGDWRYERAMGYSCPDDPNRPGWCDPLYAGFFNQVFDAAGQLQNYKNNPDSFGYRAGRTHNILYNPDASCGTKSVYIENVATASLYIYTPYTPNEAAMNNLYGEGDGCSAYGNRNFWRLFTDWFGPTDAPVSKPKPAEPKPAEPKPAESKPAESKPAESKPAEPKPAESKPAEPAPSASATVTTTPTPKASQAKAEAAPKQQEPVAVEEVPAAQAPAEAQPEAQQESLSVIPKPAAPEDLPMNQADANQQQPAVPNNAAQPSERGSNGQQGASNDKSGNGAMSVVPSAKQPKATTAPTNSVAADGAAATGATESQATVAEAAAQEAGSALTIAGVLILAGIGLAGVVLVAASRRLSR